MAAAVRPPLRLVLVERSDGYAAVVASLLAAGADPPELVRFAAVEVALRHLARAHADCVLLDAGELDGAARILRVAPAMPFASDRTDQPFIRAVVDIAQGLGKETVAEFASDPELVHFLATQGADDAQGFEIGRPQPLDAVLAQRSGATAQP